MDGSCKPAIELSYGSGGLEPGTRLAMQAGGFLGNNGQPPSDLPAKLKRQNSEFSALNKTVPPVLSMPSGCVVLGDVQHKLRLEVV